MIVNITTMFTHSHGNMPLGQSEHAYYHSYFIKSHKVGDRVKSYVYPWKSSIDNNNNANMLNIMYGKEM